jgi:hypothetical protein
MDKYLQTLLLEIKTLIFPGLGAITITNEKTGELLFMPYLKFDDGKLAKCMSEKEGMTELDAKNVVSKYVQNIIQTLDRGEAYSMYQFGAFKKDESGDVQFEAWGEASVNETPAAQIEVEAHEMVEELIEPVAEVTEEQPEEMSIEEVPVKPTETTTTPIVAIDALDSLLQHSTEDTITTHSLDELLSSEAVVAPPKNEEVIVAPVVITETPTTVEPTPVIETIPETKKENKSVTNDDKTIIGDESFDEATVEKHEPIIVIPAKKKRKLIYLLAPLLLLATIYLIGFTQYKSLSSKFPFMHKIAFIFGQNGEEKPKIVTEKIDAKKTNETPIPDDSQAIETPDGTVEEPIAETMPEAEVIATPEKVEAVVKEPKQAIVANSGSAGNFHIIAGSFGNEGNANRFADKLTKNGNDGQVIGKAGGLFLVSMASYGSMTEAKNALNELKSSTPGSYIFIKK